MIVPRQMAAPAGVDLSQNQTKNIGGFSIVLVVITAVCIVMRFTSRRITDLGLSRDDWTFLAGSLIAEGLFIVSCIYAFDAGLGAHWTTLSPQQIALFPKLNYAYNILNLSCYPLIKLSILFLYLRIFVSRKFRIFCWGGVVFVSCMLIANTLVGIFACRPVKAFYDMTITDATCINSVHFYWATAVLNVLTDLYILVLPMPIVWTIQTTLRRKIAISLIFVLGGLTFIVSIIRIVYYLDYSNDDPSYSFVGTAYATPAEVCLAIVVASAPTWRPVWAKFSDMASQVFSSIRSKPTSRGSKSVEPEEGSDLETWKITTKEYGKKENTSTRITPSAMSDDGRSAQTANNAV